MNETRKPVHWLVRVLAFLVWAATSVFGLVEIYFGRQTFVRIYSQFSSDINVITLLGNVVVIILGLVWLGYVIVAGEINLRRIETGKGWSLFAWAVAIELLVLILYLVA